MEDLKTSLKELESYIESQDSKETLNKERDEWFIGILNDLHLGNYDIDNGCKEYYNSKGNWMIVDWKNGTFWLSYYRIWGVLKDKYDMEYSDVLQYTKTMLLEHTNWQVKTTFTSLPILSMSS